MLTHFFRSLKRTAQAPMFSFTRLRGADPTLGVEMASTGEVACFGKSVPEAFIQALLATGFKLPFRTRNVLISIAHDSFRKHFLDSARILSHMGFNGHQHFGGHFDEGRDHGGVPYTEGECRLRDVTHYKLGERKHARGGVGDGV